mgnify:CR=1 FL=1
MKSITSVKTRLSSVMNTAAIPSPAYSAEDTIGYLRELHSLRHTFATNLVNGVKQSDGTVKTLTVKQVADLLGHSTTQVTEMYYVKKDTTRLNCITNDFNL